MILDHNYAYDCWKAVKMFISNFHGLLISIYNHDSDGNCQRQKKNCLL